MTGLIYIYINNLLLIFKLADVNGTQTKKIIVFTTQITLIFQIS